MSERSRADNDTGREAGFRNRIGTKAYELLADGEFHDYEALIRALLPLVPPHMAMRRVEADRTRQHYLRDPTEPTPPRRNLIETDRKIAIGARAFVRKVLADSTHLEISPRGRIPRGTVKQIRYAEGVNRRRRA